MPDLNVPALERAVAAVPVADQGCDLDAAGAVIETSVTGRIVIEDRK